MSKTAKMRRQEEKIKQAIVDGHRRGVCDSEGRSVLNEQGLMTAQGRTLGPTARTFVYRNGKMVEK